MLDRLKHHWYNLPHPLRKIAVFVAGWSVVIAGIVMLFTPGPGWASIFLGFAILAHEYVGARQVRDWLKTKFKKAYLNTKKGLNKALKVKNTKK